MPGRCAAPSGAASPHGRHWERPAAVGRFPGARPGTRFPGPAAPPPPPCAGSADAAAPWPGRRHPGHRLAQPTHGGILATGRLPIRTVWRAFVHAGRNRIARLKFVIMHARRGSPSHFTLDGGRLAMLMSGALLRRGVGGRASLSRPGARRHAACGTGGHGAAGPARRLLRRYPAPRLALLADKVGILQARLAGVDALSRRLAISCRHSPCRMPLPARR